MYKRCVTEESVQRQRQLEHCLLELMADLPYDQITVLHLCQQCNISRKSFYRYFDNKEDCLHALIDHTLMEGSVFYEPDVFTGKCSLDFCIRFFQFWQMQTILLDALERNGMSLQMLQLMVRYAMEEAGKYQQVLGIMPDHLMEHVVYTIGGIMGLVLSWHHGRYQKTPEQMGTILYSMVHLPKEELN